MEPPHYNKKNPPDSGWLRCPTDKTCRMAIVEGKVHYVEDDRNTGSRWITVTQCPNACVFGGIAFCRRFAVNRGSGKSE